MTHCLGELPRRPYRASIVRDGTRIDTWVTPQPDGDWLLELDGVTHPIDEELDLLALVPDGTPVTFERGGIEIEMQRLDGKLAARARTTDGPAHGTETFTDLEAAFVDLVRRAQPRICFSCAHSDYEPSTGFGGRHLQCFVGVARKYAAVAVSTDRLVRKWGPTKLPFRWVDEMDVCPEWSARPPSHGYRG